MLPKLIIKGQNKQKLDFAFGLDTLSLSLCYGLKKDCILGDQASSILGIFHLASGLRGKHDGHFGAILQTNSIA